MAFQPFSPWIPSSIASSNISQRRTFSAREESLDKEFHRIPGRSSTESTRLNTRQYTKRFSPPPSEPSSGKAKVSVRCLIGFMYLTGDGKGLSPTQPHEILPPKFSSPFCQASTLDLGVHLSLNIKVGASSNNLSAPLKRYVVLYSFVSMLNSLLSSGLCWRTPRFNGLHWKIDVSGNLL